MAALVSTSVSELSAEAATPATTSFGSGQGTRYRFSGKQGSVVSYSVARVLLRVWEVGCGMGRGGGLTRSGGGLTRFELMEARGGRLSQYAMG